jgi:hypothetical protein
MATEDYILMNVTEMNVCTKNVKNKQKDTIEPSSLKKLFLKNLTFKDIGEPKNRGWSRGVTIGSSLLRRCFSGTLKFEIFLFFVFILHLAVHSRSDTPPVVAATVAAMRVSPHVLERFIKYRS